MSAFLAVLLPLLSCALPDDAPTGGKVEEPEPHYTARFLLGPGQSDSIRALAFSPDGETLVVSCTAEATRFIRTRDGEAVGEFKMQPFSLAYSKDGTRLFLVAEHRFELLDAQRVASLPFEPSADVGFTGMGLEQRNGKLIVTLVPPGSPAAKPGAIRVGDELVGVGEGRGGPGRPVLGSSVRDAILSIVGPAGTYVRLQILPRGKTRPQDVLVQRQARRRVGARDEFVPVQQPQPGENLLWHLDDARRYVLRSAKTGRVVAMVTPEGIDQGGEAVVSPDGGRIAIVGRERKNYDQFAVAVYRVATGEREMLAPFPKSTWYDVAFSADGSKLYVGTWQTLEVLDLAKKSFGERVELSPYEPEKTRPRGRGAAGAVANAAADSFNFGKVDYSGPRQLQCLAVSARGIAAVGDANGNVRLWDLGSKSLLYTFERDPKSEAKVEAIDFSPDGKWLAYFLKGELHLVNVSHVGVAKVRSPDGPHD